MLKKPIEAGSISAIKILELEEVNEDEGPLVKRQRSRQLSWSAPTKGKMLNFLGDRSDEIALEVIEMLLVEVQSATGVHCKYWSDKYSSYVETCDSIYMVETGLAL